MLQDISRKVYTYSVFGDSLCSPRHFYHSCRKKGLGVVFVHGCRQPDFSCSRCNYLGSYDKGF